MDVQARQVDELATETTLADSKTNRQNGFMATSHRRYVSYSLGNFSFDSVGDGFTITFEIVLDIGHFPNRRLGNFTFNDRGLLP